MKPIYVEGMKDVLLPPKGTEDYISILPILRTEGRVTSCWQMSWKERLYVLFTGRVWFDCSSLTHPPIRLRVR